MSADLFAEFNSQQDNQSPASQLQQPSPQKTSHSNDLFSLTGSQSRPQFNTQPLNQWSNTPSQANLPPSWSNQQDSAQAASTALTDNDDDFGDFETATPQPQSQAFPRLQESNTAVWHAPPVSQRPPDAKPAIVRAPTTDILHHGLVDLEAPAPESLTQSTSLGSWGQQESLSRPTPWKAPSDSNVLFDAEDFELEGGEYDEFDEDDFGDFETVAQPAKKSESWAQPPTQLRSSNAVPKPPAVTAPSMDLLSLDDPPETASQEQPHVSQSRGPLSFGAAGTFIPSQAKPPDTGSKQLHHKHLSQGSKNMHKPKVLNKSISELSKPQVGDEDWGAWDDFASSSMPQTSTKLAPASESWDWEPSAPTTSTQVSEDIAPPINVPPPSVILSAFPELFTTADALFKPISGQPSIKDRVLSNPKASEFLQGYILLAVTAGRVIAGRKQRWHRDKILAKSMSISTAGSKGMKLAGVDKTQSAREDREAEDLATTWKEYVGRARSAVVAVNSAKNMTLKVPELSGNMQVHTAKGAMTSPKPCVICGLKRDERVAKVDFEVEDSFGEWWTEHWGHRACKNFWIEHEQRLRQR